jgi:Uma2 family endonuclease
MAVQDAPETRYRITTAQYHKMGEAGVFAPAERVELLDGVIYRMSPIGRRHAACSKRTNAFFSSALAGRAIVSVADPVELSPHDEPQPDVALLAPREDFYLAAAPAPADTLLAIEISDTTLAHDRQTKLPRYAAAGVRESWIVYLRGRVLEVHRDPSPAGYRTVRPYRGEERVSPLAFPDLGVSYRTLAG